MLILDGATGTELARLVPGERPPYAEMPMRRQDVIEAVHMAYLRSGADIITTTTLCCRSPLQAETAARIARRCADAAPGPRFVAGSLGPGFYSRDTARALIRGGADFLLFETITSAACVAQAAEAARSLGPAVYCATPTASGALLSGDCIEAFLRACEAAGAVAAGLNCGCGAEALAALIPKMRSLTVLPLIAYPSVKPDERLADILAPYFGQLAVAGGCCGSTPAHIAALARRVRNHN